MTNVYEICFLVGVGLTLIFALLGSIFDFLGADGIDIDIGGVDLNIPLSPTVYLCFLTVFGGVGMITEISGTPFKKFVNVGIALAVAFLISFSINRFVIRKLKNAQNTSAPDTEELVGLMAVVNEAIPQDGYGEIRYSINGNSYTSPAKSSDKRMIKAGSEVTICWIDEHVYYVSEIETKEIGGN